MKLLLPARKQVIEKFGVWMFMIAAYTSIPFIRDLANYVLFSSGNSENTYWSIFINAIVFGIPFVISFVAGVVAFFITLSKKLVVSSIIFFCILFLWFGALKIGVWPWYVTVPLSTKTCFVIVVVLLVLHFINANLMVLFSKKVRG
jgi:hypothetical protein